LTKLFPAATWPSTGIFSADRDDVGRDAHLAAVAAHERLGGREIHQRPDRAARPRHAARLEELRQREEEDHRRRLEPLADAERADDGDQHQHVDVERAVTHREPRALRDRQAARHRREAEQQRLHQLGRPGQPRRPPGGHRHAGADHEALPIAKRADRYDGILVLQPRAHAGLRHGFRDVARRQPRGVVLHTHPLREHVGVQRLETVEPPEPALQNRHLFVAVHALDLEDRLGVDLADFTRRRARHQALTPRRLPA
jgi:hypothetical protein